MKDDNRLYRVQKNPGYLMTNPAIIPSRIKGDPAYIASLIGHHITVHIDCDHWWTLAEARIVEVGFAITEKQIRECQNLPLFSQNELIQHLAHRQFTHAPGDDTLTQIQTIKTKFARHTVLVEIEAFDGEQHSIGQMPKQARICDRVALPHWGYFFSIWPNGKSRKDGDCPQAIYEEGSMRTTMMRPPSGSTIH